VKVLCTHVHAVKSDLIKLMTHPKRTPRQKNPNVIIYRKLMTFYIHELNSTELRVNSSVDGGILVWDNKEHVIEKDVERIV